jgi:ABC-type proline/glycine betaine transport system permease subunit
MARYDDDRGYDDDAGPEYEPHRGRRAAREAVSGPAIGLMVTGILGIIGAIVGLVANLIQTGMAAEQAERDGDQLQDFQKLLMMSEAVIVGVAILQFILYALVLLGALRMKALQSYGMAMTSSILALMPCSLCCLVGLPIGIWSLMTLNRPEVKAAFPGGPPPPSRERPYG